MEVEAESVASGTVGLKVTGTDLSGPYKVSSDEFNNEARAVFSVSTTFPWSDE